MAALESAAPAGKRKTEAQKSPAKAQAAATRGAGDIDDSPLNIRIFASRVRLSRSLREPPLIARSPNLGHTLHLRKIAMRIAARVILQADVVALLIDEARLPVLGIESRIVNGDHVFELVADLADTFRRDELVAVGQPAGVE